MIILKLMKVYRKFIKFFLLNLMLILILIGCGATYKITIYDQFKLQRITSWYVEFTYEAGEIEQKISSAGEMEAKVTKTGELSSDLQLKDDIFFLLKDEYNISVVRDKNYAAGFIKIHPVHFYRGFKSLDVTIYDPENNLIARIKINNGTRNATFKDDDEFAEYCAKAIARVILNK